MKKVAVTIPVESRHKKYFEKTGAGCEFFTRRLLL